jgi:hypothetical protein
VLSEDDESVVEDGTIECGSEAGAIWSRRHFKSCSDGRGVRHRAKRLERVYDYFTSALIDQSTDAAGGHGDILLSHFDEIPFELEILLVGDCLSRRLEQGHFPVVYDPRIQLTETPADLLAQVRDLHAGSNRVIVASRPLSEGGEVAISLYSEERLWLRVNATFGANGSASEPPLLLVMERFGPDGRVEFAGCYERLASTEPLMPPRVSPGATVMDLRLGGQQPRSGRLQPSSPTSLRQVQHRPLADELERASGRVYDMVQARDTQLATLAGTGGLAPAVDSAASAGGSSRWTTAMIALGLCATLLLLMGGLSRRGAGNAAR